jgi:hypothetical protein
MGPSQLTFSSPYEEDDEPEEEEASNCPMMKLMSLSRWREGTVYSTSGDERLAFKGGSSSRIDRHCSESQSRNSAIAYRVIWSNSTSKVLSAVLVVTKTILVRSHVSLNPLNHTSGKVNLVITIALWVIGHNIVIVKGPRPADILKSIRRGRQATARGFIQLSNDGSHVLIAAKRGIPPFRRRRREADIWRRIINVVPLLIDVFENWLKLQRIIVQEFCNHLQSRLEWLHIKSVKFSANRELLSYAHELLIGLLHGVDGEIVTSHS